MIFGSWGRSWAMLVPRGCPKCSKTAPKVDFIEFSTILETILERCLMTFHVHLTQISRSILHYMFNYIPSRLYATPPIQFQVSVLKFSARLRLFARSALDIYLPPCRRHFVRGVDCRGVQSSIPILTSSKFQAQGWRLEVGVGVW